jgi:general secretion pathway protein D
LRTALTVLALFAVVPAAADDTSPSSPVSEVRRLDLSPRPPAAPPAQGTPAPPPSDLYVPGSAAEPSPGLPGGVSAAGRDYNISFDNAPVNTVVRGILGDVLKLPFSIDPRVQGTVTLSTGGPVTRDELLKILEVALQSIDASMVYDNTRFSIVPASATADGSAAGSIAFAGGTGAPPGYGVTVVPLRHVKAGAVKDLLDGFIARSGLARASIEGNMLLLRGASDQRDSLAAIARSFDIDAMRDQSAAIVTLRNSGPEELIGQLNHLAAVDSQGQPSALIRFEPLGRLNAILVVAADRRQIAEATAWIHRLDQPSSEGANYFLYKAQNTRATELAQVLAQTFGDGHAPGAEAPPRPASETPPVAPIGDATSPMPPPATDVRPTDSGSSVTTLAGDVRIVANNATNSLIIRAPARIYRQILDVVRQIDRPPVQVYISVMIAEVTLNDTLRYGVQAYLQRASFSIADATKLPLAPTLPGFSFLLNDRNSPSLMLDALSAVTNVRVVSSPSIVTLDNQPAIIKVGNQIPIVVQQTQGTQSAGAPLINTVEYRDAGVSLRVTPRVSETDLVSMDITQELSAVVTPIDNTSATLTPTFSQRAINSTIAVYNRQTVILGGLIASQQNLDRNSIPLINRIPILGDLLGTTSNIGTRTELVVFITPRVIHDAVDASRVSEDVRNALQLLGDPAKPR